MIAAGLQPESGQSEQTYKKRTELITTRAKMTHVDWLTMVTNPGAAQRKSSNQTAVNTIKNTKLRETNYN